MAHLSPLVGLFLGSAVARGMRHYIQTARLDSNRLRSSKSRCRFAHRIVATRSLLGGMGLAETEKTSKKPFHTAAIDIRRVFDQGISIERFREI
jgi:hypothetical protein